MTKKQYRTPKVSVGTVKKSIAAMASRWFLRNGRGHRQAKNGHCLASCRLSAVLDLEGVARPTRTTAHFARGPRSDPQDVPGESRLGCIPHPWRTAETVY